MFGGVTLLWPWLSVLIWATSGEKEGFLETCSVLFM